MSPASPRTVCLVLLLAVVGALAVPPLVRAAGEEGPAVGTFLQSGAGSLHSADLSYRVELPSGTLVVRTGHPVQDISRHEPDAAVIETGDRRYLPVAWQLRPASVLAAQPSGEQFEVALVVGADRYDLAADESELADGASGAGVVAAKAGYVVVPDDPERVALEVTYDGESQRIDLAKGRVEPGIAEPLYGDVTPPVTSTCDAVPARLRVALGDQVECRIQQVVVTPYDPELGWVEDGGTWVRVPVLVEAWSLRFFDGGRRGYDADVRSVRVTVDGQEPVAVRSRKDVRREDQGLRHADGGLYVFRLDAAPEEITIATNVVGVDQYDADAPSFPIRHTASYPVGPTVD